MLAIISLVTAYIVGPVDAEVDHVSAQDSNCRRQPGALGDRKEDPNMIRDPLQFQKKPGF